MYYQGYSTRNERHVETETDLRFSPQPDPYSRSAGRAARRTSGMFPTRSPTTREAWGDLVG